MVEWLSEELLEGKSPTCCSESSQANNQYCKYCCTYSCLVLHVHPDREVGTTPRRAAMMTVASCSNEASLLPSQSMTVSSVTRQNSTSSPSSSSPPATPLATLISWTRNSTDSSPALAVKVSPTCSGRSFPSKWGLNAKKTTGLQSKKRKLGWGWRVQN